MSERKQSLTFQRRGKTVTVRRGDPPSADAYLFIAIDGEEFFMGHFVEGATRAEVRKLALKWLVDHGR